MGRDKKQVPRYPDGDERSTKIKPQVPHKMPPISDGKQNNGSSSTHPIPNIPKLRIRRNFQTSPRFVIKFSDTSRTSRSPSHTFDTNSINDRSKKLKVKMPKLNISSDETKEQVDLEFLQESYQPPTLLADMLWKSVQDYVDGNRIQQQPGKMKYFHRFFVSLDKELRSSRAKSVSGLHEVLAEASRCATVWNISDYSHTTRFHQTKCHIQESKQLHEVYLTIAKSQSISDLVNELNEFLTNEDVALSNSSQFRLILSVITISLHILLRRLITESYSYSQLPLLITQIHRQQLEYEKTELKKTLVSNFRMILAAMSKTYNNLEDVYEKDKTNHKITVEKMKKSHHLAMIQLSARIPKPKEQIPLVHTATNTTTFKKLRIIHAEEVPTMFIDDFCKPKKSSESFDQPLIRPRQLKKFIGTIIDEAVVQFNEQSISYETSGIISKRKLRKKFLQEIAKSILWEKYQDIEITTRFLTNFHESLKHYTKKSIKNSTNLKNSLRYNILWRSERTNYNGKYEVFDELRNLNTKKTKTENVSELSNSLLLFELFGIFYWNLRFFQREFLFFIDFYSSLLSNPCCHSKQKIKVSLSTENISEINLSGVREALGACSDNSRCNITSLVPNDAEYKLSKSAHLDKIFFSAIQTKLSKLEGKDNKSQFESLSAVLFIVVSQFQELCTVRTATFATNLTKYREYSTENKFLPKKKISFPRTPKVVEKSSVRYLSLFKTSFIYLVMMHDPECNSCVVKRKASALFVEASERMKVIQSQETLNMHNSGKIQKQMSFTPILAKVFLDEGFDRPEISLKKHNHHQLSVLPVSFQSTLEAMAQSWARKNRALQKRNRYVVEKQNEAHDAQLQQILTEHSFNISILERKHEDTKRKHLQQKEKYRGKILGLKSLFDSKAAENAEIINELKTKIRMKESEIQDLKNELKKKNAEIIIHTHTIATQTGGPWGLKSLRGNMNLNRF